jgi:hypothetical protein
MDGLATPGKSTIITDQRLIVGQGQHQLRVPTNFH